MKRTAIVTGSSSGIGEAVCKRLVKEGWQVYGLSRRGTAPEGVNAIAADVSDEQAVRKAVDEIASKAESIDLLINNAGWGISGPVEFTSAGDMMKQTEINFYGQVFCAQAVLPYMRRQRSGRIVCVSSVAAPVAIPYQGFYSASKAAVNGMALALRNEVKEFGIQVSCVMPGDASTGFTDARKKQSTGGEIYTRSRSAVAAMEKDERRGMTPDDVARVILKAASTRHMKPLYVAGGVYKLLYLFFKLAPAGFAYRIVGKMYS